MKIVFDHVWPKSLSVCVSEPEREYVRVCMYVAVQTSAHTDTLKLSEEKEMKTSKEKTKKNQVRR